MVLGEEESVLTREVSLFQGLKSTQTWYLGRKKVSCLERCPYFRGVLIEGFHCIRESVDSLCRDDADMPMTPYIRKTCNRPNAAFVSLFR